MRFYLPCLLLLLAACAIRQENGNEVGFQPAPIIAGNQWQISRQQATPDGRVCAVSAGEMEVSQLNRGGSVAVRVDTSYSMNPGDYYKILYGGDVHEAPAGQAWFSPQESQAIIADLMKGGVVYTEIQEQEVGSWAGSEYQHVDNKVNLDGFKARYEACRRFVNRRMDE